MGTIRDRFAAVWRDFAMDGVKASGAHEPVKAEIRAIGPELETAIGAAGATLIRFATKALMDADVTRAAGQLAYVWNDGTLANRKVWQWSGSAWVSADWYFDAVAGVVDTHLVDVLVARGTVFDELATDDYARRFFKSAVIGGGDADDTFWLEYRMELFGGPLYYFWVYLHSEKYGAVVASREYTGFSTNPLTYMPGTVFLSGRYNAAPNVPNDVGITAMIEFDAAAIEWTHPLTTGGATARVLRAGITVSDGEIDAQWASGDLNYRRVVTIPSTAYPTWDSLFTAFVDPNSAAQITRGTDPITNWCSPEYPMLVEMVAAHTEAVVQSQVTIGMTTLDLTNLRIPPGMTLRTRPDTLFFKANSANTAEVIDQSMTSRVEGSGTFEQRGPGQVWHTDYINVSSVVPTVEPKRLRRKHTVYIGPVTLSKTVDNNGAMLAGGTSNGSRASVDGTVFKVTANTAGGPCIGFHNSPNEVIPGTIEVRSMSRVGPHGAGAGIALLKSYAGNIRHDFRVIASDCPDITYTVGPGGTTCFRFLGSTSGITVAAALLP